MFRISIGCVLGKEPQAAIILRRIRVKSEDSAYVYAIVESHEGIATVSTSPFNVGDAHRDLELQVTPDFLDEVDAIIEELGELIYDLDKHDRR